MVLGFSGHPARSTQPRLWPGVTAEPGGAGGSLRGVSGLKGKTFYVTKTKDCRERKKKIIVLYSSLRTPDPYLLLESPRHLSPPQGP